MKFNSVAAQMGRGKLEKSMNLENFSISSAINEKFEKYVPSYYKVIECPSCGKEIRNDFDLEVEFFRRSLNLI